MPTDRSDLLQGTLEMLVLRILALEPMHGWGLAQRIEQIQPLAEFVGHRILQGAASGPLPKHVEKLG